MKAGYSRSTGLSLIVTTLGLTSGCLSGSLATSTGPRRSGSWSDASRQAAHVGEKVSFSFILVKPFARNPTHPAGLAEYAILELDDRSIDMELEDAGKFAASYQMPLDWVDREIRVRATAYRQYGQRDRVTIRGATIATESPDDERDKAIVSDALTMLVYQSRVEMRVGSENDELDFNGARLVIRRADGAASTVPVGESGIGFKVEGPDDSGQWLVQYEPHADQVNATGLTGAELLAHDRAGRVFRQQTEFMTP